MLEVDGLVTPHDRPEQGGRLIASPLEDIIEGFPLDFLSIPVPVRTMTLWLNLGIIDDLVMQRQQSCHNTSVSHISQ